MESAEWKVWTVKCGVESGERGMWSVQFKVWSVKCGV